MLQCRCCMVQTYESYDVCTGGLGVQGSKSTSSEEDLPNCSKPALSFFYEHDSCNCSHGGGFPRTPTTHKTYACMIATDDKSTAVLHSIGNLRSLLCACTISTLARFRPQFNDGENNVMGLASPTKTRVRESRACGGVSRRRGVCSMAGTTVRNEGRDRKKTLSSFLNLPQLQ